MRQIRTTEGELTASGGRFAVLASRFNSLIVDRLVEGALDTLRRHGVDDEDIELVYVPGAFELPLAALWLAEQTRFQAVIALGAVIRGATPHFDHIAGASISGLADAALRTGKPIVCGVLTCDTVDQAIERAGTKAGNKGSEAALSALEMASLCRRLES